MAALSQVLIESKPAHSPALYEWPQPYENGDDGQPWHATDFDGTTVEVDRTRKTDNTMWCRALLSLTGVSGFAVHTGPTTSPTTAWTTPTLTGLGMRWTWAHESSVHFADFTDITQREIRRTGHFAQQEVRYVMSKVTAAGTGNLVVGEGVLCHHVYLTFRADLPDVVRLEVRMSNAAGVVQTNAASIAARGAGIVSSGVTQLASIGFSDCDLILPAGWQCIQDRPANVADHTIVVDASTIPPVAGSITSNAHCFPRKMSTRRRFVIWRPAGAGGTGTLQQAQDLLAWKGLGRATADGPRSYHTQRAYGPSMSLIPRLDLGGSLTYATAKTQCETQWTNLNAAVLAGTNTFSSAGGGEFGQGTGSARLGLFHFVGHNDVDDAGGGDIGPWCGGVRHIPAFVRFASLYGSLKLDGCGVSLYERTTGAPLGTVDFASAYAGGSVAGFPDNYTGGAQFAGVKQPFNFYVQTNSGIEYGSDQHADFAGWTQRDDSWPPHFFAGQAHNDAGYYWMRNKWWPKKTGDWGPPDRSNWDFICNYRPILERVPWSEDPTAATQSFAGQAIYGVLVNYPPVDQDGSGGFAAAPHLESNPTSSAGLADTHKDPEDAQHGIRMYRYLIPLAWLGGDLMSIDDIDMLAEWFALEYTELGYLNNSQSGETNRSLLRRKEINAATPNTAAYFNGRAEAWAGFLFAAQYALATDVRRATGYPVSGIKTRAAMFFDYTRLGVIPQNGLTCRFAPGDIHGITSPFAANGFSGVPVPTNYRVMQAGLELPKVMLSYWSLLKQCESFLPQASIDQARTHFVIAWSEFVARTNLYLLGVSLGSPYNWVASWNNTTGQPEPGTTIWRGPNNQQEHWQDVCAILEYAYRASGDLAVLQTANFLGGPVAAGTPPDTRAASIIVNTDYAPGLVALMQRWTVEGADAAFAPPSINPQIQATATVNPVTEGDTTIIRAQVTAGANPTSLSYTVTAAFDTLGQPGLSVISALTLLDDGVSPDLTAGDLRFNANLDTSHIVPGIYQCTVTVIDDQGRSDSDTFPLTVGAQTAAPVVFGSVLPFPVEVGQVLTVYADVTAGDPIVSVVADCAALGGPVALELLDDGVAPDVTGSDDRYTGSFTVPLTTAQDQFTIRITATDDQDRVGTVSVPAFVVDPLGAGDLGVSVRLSPNPLHPGDVLTLVAVVNPADDPVSASIQVLADYSALGGKGAEEILDDGVAPDVTAADLRYTGEHTLSGALTAGDYSVGVNVTDRQGRSATHYQPLSVLAVVDPTDPTISPNVSPNPVVQGETFTLTVVVVPGTGPSSSGIAVVADLQAFGLGAAEALTDLGGNVWDIDVPVSLSVIPSGYRFVVTMSDAELREATAQVTVTVLAFVPADPNPLVFLPVFEDVAEAVSGGSIETMYPVLLDASERLIVYDEADDGSDVPYQIESSPDASATLGGQLPVTDTDGTTIHFVPFSVLVEPVDPPDPPDPPTDVVIGSQTGGETSGSGMGLVLEAVGA